MSDASPSTRWLPLAAIAVVVAVAAVLVVVLSADGDEEDVATATTTTSLTIPVTSATSDDATTTTADTAPSSTAVATDDSAVAVWPTATSTERFADPVEVARSFATDFVGFSELVVGEFQQGDARSGEVTVQRRANGPVTTVLVRQLGPDDSWWVIGSTTPNIEVDEPAALSTIADPVHLSGRASAFEGNVSVEVRDDDGPEALAVGNVTGRGDGELGPFTSDQAFEAPTTGRGSVLFITYSAEDGDVLEASVVRVVFAAG